VTKSDGDDGTFRHFTTTFSRVCVYLTRTFTARFLRGTVNECPINVRAIFSFRSGQTVSSTPLSLSPPLCRGLSRQKTTDRRRPPTTDAVYPLVYSLGAPRLRLTYLSRRSAVVVRDGVYRYTDRREKVRFRFIATRRDNETTTPVTRDVLVCRKKRTVLVRFFET